MSGVLCDKRVPPHVKGNMQNMIVQPDSLYGIETVPVTISHVKKLEVTDMKMCRWACGHTLRDHVRNDDIRVRLKVENTTMRCRKARLGGLDTSTGETKNTSEESLCRWDHLGEECEEDRSRDGWTVSTGTRAIETTTDEVHDRTGWRRLVSAAAAPQPSGSG